MAFYVGQHVVCVDVIFSHPLWRSCVSAFPRLNSIYTIRDIHVVRDLVGLCFYEIVNASAHFAEGYVEAAFDSRRFRPVRSTTAPCPCEDTTSSRAAGASWFEPVNVVAPRSCRASAPPWPSQEWRCAPADCVIGPQSGLPLGTLVLRRPRPTGGTRAHCRETCLASAAAVETNRKASRCSIGRSTRRTMPCRPGYIPPRDCRRSRRQHDAVRRGSSPARHGHRAATDAEFRRPFW